MRKSDHEEGLFKQTRYRELDFPYITNMLPVTEAHLMLKGKIYVKTDNVFQWWQNQIS
jgi:hypothetical protein